MIYKLKSKHPEHMKSAILRGHYSLEKIASLAVLLTFPKCEKQRWPCMELCHHILNWLSTVRAQEGNTGRYDLCIFIYRYISTYRFII